MKTVVTGATGFLGRWLVKTLSEQGHEVRALVRTPAAGEDLQKLPGVTLAPGDVTDSPSLVKAFTGAEVVFHLAGVIAYKKSDRPLMDKVNIGGTHNVVNAVRETRVRRLVHLSSVTAIGAGFTPDQILNENSEYNLKHLNLGYFETKRISEELVRNACRVGEIDAVILNPSTIYGPGDATKGSRKTQIKVAQGRFPFYTSGGASIVAVEDTIQGILSAWQKGRTGERYILSGENLLVKDLFATIADIAGVSAPKILLPRTALFAAGALGDLKAKFGKPSSVSTENAWVATMYHWFDNSKAKRELDFNPKPARYALEASVNWMKSHGLLEVSTK